MDKQNLIIILDDKITEIDATDSAAASILTFYGEDNIPLNDNNSLYEAKENILEKYSLDDISDIEMNIIIINNGTKEEYISYLYTTLKGANRLNIIDAKTLMPILARNKGFKLPAFLSINGIVYRVSSDGVTEVSSITEYANLSIDDFLFLFWVDENIFIDNSEEINTLNQACIKLQDDLDIQKKAVAKATEKNVKLSEQINCLQQQNDELKCKTDIFEIVDDAQFKTSLKKYIKPAVNLDEFNICQKSEINNEVIIIIAHKKSGAFYKFSVKKPPKQKKDLFNDDVLSKTAMALYELHYMSQYNMLENSRFAGLKVGDVFEFGSYNGKTIKWRVLNIKDGAIYVVSEYVLGNMPYDDRNGRWDQSLLKEWLNNTFFFEAFNDGERQFITRKYPYNTYLRLLSFEDVKAYFKSERDRIACSIETLNPSAWWYNCYQGGLQECIVSSNGALSDERRSYLRLSTSTSCGIRPAMWIEF